MKVKNSKKLVWLLPVIIVIWTLVGPMLSDNQDWQDTEYAAHTVRRIAGIAPLVGAGGLQISFAKEDISTEVGQPIMGYTDRKPLESLGVLDKCYVRALSLSVGGKDVTVVSVDMMILFEDVVSEIVKRSGLKRNELYFNATHTHSGPGGWAKGAMKEFFYGKYKQKYFDHIVNKAVAAIKASRKNYRPAEVGYIKVAAPEWIENRIYADRSANTYLSAIIFKATDSNKILAAVTSYSAHGTVVRRETRKCSADYPGYLCQFLKEKVEFAMFLSGAMGDARPKASGEEGAVKMGRTLAEKLLDSIDSASYEQQVEMANINLAVEIPASRFALTANWELFPLFMKYFQPQYTEISVLRIGDIVLAGWPADSAGELATPLVEWGRERSGDKLNIILTSFNGSWRGYATTYDTYMSKDSYATRMMGFMGPWFGEYLTALTKKLIDRTDKGE